MILVGTYLAYLAASFAVTVWVASTLHKNGRVFLVDAFGGNRELADSVNHLLVVGFYLINLGYAMLVLKESRHPQDAAAGIEIFSEKIGAVLLVLGAMHFLNIFIFSRVRKRALLANAPVPVAPQAFLVAPPVALAPVATPASEASSDAHETARRLDGRLPVAAGNAS